ncbi:hypothetical protein GC207_02865 [bacterium]|nr:hypothetical protein [bacterium]
MQLPHFQAVERHRFMGRWFRLLWRRPKIPRANRERGFRIIAATQNTPKVRTIEVDPNLSERDLLRALLDEGIHACFWDLDNDRVAEASRSLAYLLWRVGYRLKRAK